MITRRQKSAEGQRKMKGKGNGPDWVYRGWTERTAPPWAAGQTPHRPWYLDLSSSATASRLKKPKSTFSSPKTPRKGMPFATDYKLYKSCSLQSNEHQREVCITFFCLHGFLISKQKWEFKKGGIFSPLYLRLPKYGPSVGSYRGFTYINKPWFARCCNLRSSKWASWRQIMMLPQIVVVIVAINPPQRRHLCFRVFLFDYIKFATKFDIMNVAWVYKHLGITRDRRWSDLFCFLIMSLGSI